MKYKHTIAFFSFFFSSCILALILGIFSYKKNLQTISASEQNLVIASGCIIAILIIGAMVETRRSSKENEELFPLIASFGVVAAMFNVIMFFSWSNLFFSIFGSL